MENTQYYMEIPLTRGLVAKVSPHRFNELNAFKWSAQPSRDTFYAFRKSARKKGTPRVSILMHRVILGLEAGDPRHGTTLIGMASTIETEICGRPHVGRISRIEE